jgi:hypothetical protein
MAIAYDTSSKGTDTTSTGQSWSHTCTGSDRLLVVGVSHTAATDGTLTGITYNGAAMTKAASIRRSDNVCWTQLWYLVGPASGSNTIQITLSGSTRHSATASSYTGVKQTGQPDASTSTNASGDQVCTVSTTADNSWGVIVGQSASAAAGTNVTERQLETSFGQFHGDSNGPKTPAGSFSMTMTGTGAGTGVMATFAPAASPVNGQMLAVF